MTVATLVLAILGVVLAVVSLAWQVKTHRDGGVRVRVSFVAQLHDTAMVAAVSRNGCAVEPKGDEPRDLAVKVQNAGRQQAVVTAVYVGTKDIMQIVESSGPRLPLTLAVSEESTVGYLTSEEVRTILDANAEAANTPRREVVGVVHLGNGSKASASLPVDVVEHLYRDARESRMPWGMYTY